MTTAEPRGRGCRNWPQRGHLPSDTEPRRTGWDVIAFPGFYRVLRGSARFYRVRFYEVLRGSTTFGSTRSVLQRSTRFYRVLQLHGFYARCFRFQRVSGGSATCPGFAVLEVHRGSKRFIRSWFSRNRAGLYEPAEPCRTRRTSENPGRTSGEPCRTLENPNVRPVADVTK